jgi:hypothetical protein
MRTKTPPGRPASTEFSKLLWKHGIRTKDVCDATGYSQGAIEKWRCGLHGSKMSPGTLMVISKFLTERVGKEWTIAKVRNMMVRGTEK